MRNDICASDRRSGSRTSIASGSVAPWRSSSPVSRSLAPRSAPASWAYAIQRGATCTVAAVDEIISERARPAPAEPGSKRRCGSPAACSSRRRCTILPPMPAGYAVSRWTVVGGVLLGVGAYVNGACVFGAIARFGSGEWAYICSRRSAFPRLPERRAALRRAHAARPLLDTLAVLDGRRPGSRCVFVAFALWRLGRRGLARRTWRRRAAGIGLLAARVWSPHAATTVIAITFVVMLLLGRQPGPTPMSSPSSRAACRRASRRAPCSCSRSLGAGSAAGRPGFPTRHRPRPPIAALPRRRRADGLGQPRSCPAATTGWSCRHAARVALRVARLRDDGR